MQLIKSEGKKNGKRKTGKKAKAAHVTSTLLAASCALLGNPTIADDWEFDTAIMYYSEGDRVSALEGIVQAKKTFKNYREFSAKFVADSLTGASANGAVPQAEPQTFTRPSGNGQYTSNAGETPLDDTFKDTRYQLNLQWSQPLSERYIGSTGIQFSTEYDYLSVAVNGMLGRYFNNKNTTINMGVSYASDTIDPVGGKPAALSDLVIDNGQFSSQEAFNTAFADSRESSSDTKTTLDWVLGVSQVINRKWITQFNIGLSEVSGYQTDPYKFVSIVDDAGIAVRHLHESRPDSRTKQSFYSQSKYHFKNGIWDASYRLSNDDWGVQSHTLETRYRFLLSQNRYIEPHIRLYQQSEADFYTPFYNEHETLTDFASADYRIGKLNTYTIGIRYGMKLSKGREYGLRLEYYNQTPQDAGKTAPGALSTLDLYPSVDALVVQFDYHF